MLNFYSKSIKPLCFASCATCPCDSGWVHTAAYPLSRKNKFLFTERSVAGRSSYGWPTSAQGLGTVLIDFVPTRPELWLLFPHSISALGPLDSMSAFGTPASCHSAWTPLGILLSVPTSHPSPLFLPHLIPQVPTMVRFEQLLFGGLEWARLAPTTEAGKRVSSF